MKPKTREFAAGIVLLWALLTGFFWLGYWVGNQDRIDRTEASVSNFPRAVPASPKRGPEPSQPPDLQKETTKQDVPARL